MPSLENNLLHLTRQLREYENKYQRQPHAVSLLAVSKGQAIEKIKRLAQAGHVRFGENYLQEALAKITALHSLALEWHFIGNIQSNKTRAIAENFAWVHTVTSCKIAKRLDEQRPLTLPPLNVCLEVNISQEATKSGLLSQDDLLKLAQYCHSCPRLQLRGLMAIPAPTASFAAQCSAFQQLAEIQQQLHAHGIGCDTLSMGMSADFEAAIAAGATLVRIGSALFGSRSSGIDNQSI